MRVILEPLIGDMPLVGALSIFFLRKPVSQCLFRSVFPLTDDTSGGVTVRSSLPSDGGSCELNSVP